LHHTPNKVQPAVVWESNTLTLRNPKEPKVGYDFSRVEQGFDGHGGLAYLVRARDFDRAIWRCIARYPEATVVNIGAGLDTTFSRVDNDKIRWYDLNLPDGMVFRQQFIPETPRSTCIAKSVFDYAWFDEAEF